MGKGMDGHAGGDLIIKVPCGTLVWRSRTPRRRLRKMKKPDDDEDEDEEKKSIFSAPAPANDRSSAHRAANRRGKLI
jgi:GTPase involved in cell partitioning and DNA repair